MAKAKGAAAQRRPRSSRSLSVGASALGSVHRRPAMLEVDVDYSSEDNYLFSYLGERTFGIFVRTLTPAPIGTFLILRFAAAAAGPAASGVIRVSRRLEVVTKATPLGMRKLSLDDPGDAADLADEGSGDASEGAIEGAIEGTIDEAGDEGSDGTVDEVIDEGSDGGIAEGIVADLEAELGSAPASELKIEGEVIWVNPYRPSVKDNLHPGMGVRFVALDTATHRRLLALVGRVAYL